jgi:putative thioredoxin
LETHRNEAPIRDHEVPISTQPMSDPADNVIDVTTETFESLVMERSKQVPIVVDFWAPWCGPCRQLGPVLEGLADEYGGRFVLAKVNIEENEPLAQSFNVQSIPYVAAMGDGQLMDAFMGVLPEAAIREWLERILPSPADALARAASALEADSPGEAEANYREALALQDDHIPARIGLARVLLHSDRRDEAEAIVAELETRGFLEPEAQHVKAELEIQTVAAETGGVDAAQRAVEETPDDLSLRIRLADALAAAGRPAEAMDCCLEVIARDKTGAGVEAKQTMLNILNLVESDHDLAATYRHKLASVLY